MEHYFLCQRCFIKFPNDNVCRHINGRTTLKTRKQKRLNYLKSFQNFVRSLFSCWLRENVLATKLSSFCKLLQAFRRKSIMNSIEAERFIQWTNENIFPSKQLKLKKNLRCGTSLRAFIWGNVNSRKSKASVSTFVINTILLARMRDEDWYIDIEWPD